MLPRHVPKEEEEDSGRRRNQFSKDERLHLLNIMSQYAPLLDDTSASVFDRREIWRAIERDFHLAGFIGKTSAQLKKYWQNYKYHGRRTQAVNRAKSAVRALSCKDSRIVYVRRLHEISGPMGDVKFALLNDARHFFSVASARLRLSLLSVFSSFLPTFLFLFSFSREFGSGRE